MYGILADGLLIYAPQTLCDEDGVHYHPSAEMYLARGYLPIAETEKPVEEEKGVTYEKRYSIEDCVIVGRWYREMPDADDIATPTINERLTALEGAVLAIMGGDIGV